MKILVEQKILANMLNVVARATAKKNDLVPAATRVHMEAANGLLTLTAYDLEVAIKTSTADVEVSKEGEVLVSNHLVEFVNRLDSRPITLELTKASKLAIAYGKSKGNLNTYEKEGWVSPQFEGEGVEELFTVKANELKKALDAVIFATAADHYQKVFTGVLFDIKDGVINLVASDTHKLAWYVISDTESTKDKQIILPTRGLKEIMRVLKDAEDLVTVSTNGNTLVCKTEDTLVSMCLMAGQYPNYQAIIPQSSHSVKMDTNNLRSTLERFRTLPLENKLQIPAAKLFINGAKEMKMEFNSDIAGAITEIVSLEESASLDEEMALGFNTIYMQEIIKGIGPMTQIGFTDPSKPALITGEDVAAKYVLVPLR